MSLIEFKRDPSPRELRQFALLWLPGICLAVAVWTAFRAQGPWTAGLVLAALASLALGLWRPRWFRPLYVAWMALAFPFGWLMSHALMAAIYLLLITPIGLILRVARRDPLARQFDREAQSYWMPTPPPSRDPNDSRARYFRQY
jgi:hypothetical protein